MDGVAFVAKDGMCPRFEAPNGEIYLIQDKKVGADYQYALQVKRYKPEKKTFLTKEECDAYIANKTDRRHYSVARYEGKTGYFLSWATLVCEGLTVTILYAPDVISEWFESYVDCLQYAKEYVLTRLEQMEKEQNRQTDLFGLLD